MNNYKTTIDAVVDAVFKTYCYNSKDGLKCDCLEKLQETLKDKLNKLIK